MHILLADDSVPAQNMGKKILADAGHDVVTASNGLDALRKIEDKKPDLAILDIFMPGYTGLELCQRLRADSQMASLPIVLTVGKLEPYRAEDADRVHSNAVIVKPFAAAELLAVVQRLCGNAAPASQPAEVTQPAPAPAAARTAEPAPQAESEEFPDEMLFGKGIGELELPAPATGRAKGFGFDPDAGHTPFSASAIDLTEAKPATTGKVPQPAAAGTEPPPILKAEPQPAHAAEPEAQPAPAAEVKPEEQSPHYSGETNDSLTSIEAPKAELAEEPNYSGDAAELASLNAPSVEETPAEYGSEAERSPLDIPEHDPMMEFSGQPATEAVGSPATASVEAASVPVSPGSDAELPEMDSERRAAFDALFASAETLMEEPAQLSAHTTPAKLSEELLPGFASLGDDHEVDVVPDAEIEFAGEAAHPLQLEPVVSEADPFLLEEVELDRPEKVDAEPVAQAEAHDPLLVCDAATFAGDALVAGPLDAPASPAAAAPVELEPLEVTPLEAPAEAAPEEVAPIEAAPEEAIPPAASAAEILDLAEPLVEPEPEPLEIAASETTPQPLEIAAPAPVAEAVSPTAGEPLAEVEPLAAVEAANAPETVATSVETPAPTHAEAPPTPAVPLHAASAAVPSAPPIAEQITAARSSVASIEAERIHQAVEKVFARYKPLLVAAIVREIARNSD